MNADIGKGFVGDVCEDCKVKIEAATAKLKKSDLLRPKRVARRFARLLCKDCHSKISKKVRRGVGR